MKSSWYGHTFTAATLNKSLHNVLPRSACGQLIYIDVYSVGAFPHPQYTCMLPLSHSCSLQKAGRECKFSDFFLRSVHEAKSFITAKCDKG